MTWVGYSFFWLTTLLANHQFALLSLLDNADHMVRHSVSAGTDTMNINELG